ncbi:hypothetical protein TNCV_3224711, partial [Trichonephila clavipes]
MFTLDPVSKSINLFEVDSSLDDYKFSCLMRLEYRVIVLCSLTGVESLEHWVAKLSVVVEIVGFDIGLAAEEKRTGDDRR